MKKRLIPSVCTGFAAALYFFIVLPVQTYIACADTPPYSLGDLLGEFSLYFLITWVVVCAALFALSYVPLAKPTIDAKGRKHKKISLQFHVLVLAVVVAAIVESGLLSIGLPELNGDFTGYRSATRLWLDLMALVTIVIIPLACYRWIKRHVTWIAIAIAFYVALSLLDVHKAESFADSQGDMIIHDFVPRYDVVAESAFAPSNNVIVLIPDTVSSHAAAEIFRSDPELASHFTGFVNYVNNLGMHWTTLVGIPGLMTGKYYENSSELTMYSSTPFTDKSFIKDFIDNKVPVFLNLGMFPLGWSNQIGESESSKLRIRPSQTIIENTLELCIGDLSLFRIAPYGLKERVAMASEKARGDKENKPDVSNRYGNINLDEIVWPLLAQRPIDGAFPGSLHVHHSHGGHPPFTRDENGKRVNVQDPAFRDYVSFCKFSLKQLAACFDAWRASGVYDASTIILCSDHGVSNIWPETQPYLHGIPSYAFPMLMVKPEGANTPYLESVMPTSHARIAPLVRALRSGSVSQDKLESILRAEERFCRSCFNGKIIDWEVAGDWIVHKIERPDVQKSVSTLQPLQIDKTYSLRVNAPPEDYPDFLSENGNRAHSVGLHIGDLRKPLKLTFKTPSANALYDIFLVLRYNKNPVGNIVRIIAKSGSSVDYVLNARVKDANNHILLDNCKSDNNGFVNIEIYYAGESKVDINVLQMRLSRYISSNLAENGFFHGDIAKSMDLLQSWRVDACFADIESGDYSLSGSGNNATVETPKWLLKNGKQGVCVQGQTLSADFKLVCKGGGDIVFCLRGIDRKCDEKRLPIYIDYESFTINGKEMLKNPISLCYDMPHKIPFSMADSETVHVSVRLKPHQYEYLKLRQLLLDANSYTHQSEKSVDGCLCLPEMQKFLAK